MKMNEILDVIHKTIYQFFDVCGDNEEVSISDKDKLLLEVNKAICNNLKILEQESCEDVISRQAVLNAITANCIWENEYNLTSSRIKKAVESLPPVNPQSKMGHWIDTDNYYQRWKCSECNCHTRDTQPPYCPNCGAKMFEPQESEDTDADSN